jgi:hypothetical protein
MELACGGIHLIIMLSYKMANDKDSQASPDPGLPLFAYGWPRTSTQEPLLQDKYVALRENC